MSIPATVPEPRLAPAHASAATGRTAHPAALLPGLVLAAGLAGLAFALRQLPGLGNFSPMILAILLGILFHNLIGTPARARPASNSR